MDFKALSTAHIINLAGLPRKPACGYLDNMYLPTTHQHMTAEEFAALPDGPPYFQLVEGELFFMATPSVLHQEIVLNLAFSIKAHLRLNLNLGQVIIAPSDVRLDESNVFEPDVYFVSRARAEIMTKQGANGAPDLVAEVLSPSTQRLDREKKRVVYFRGGVREVWLVVPETRQVEVYFPDTDKPQCFSGNEVLMSEILPGWSLVVNELFT